MTRHVTAYIDRAMVTYPVTIEVSNPTGPRTRLHLTRAEARELKNQLATILNPKGGRHGR